MILIPVIQPSKESAYWENNARGLEYGSKPDKVFIIVVSEVAEVIVGFHQVSFRFFGYREVLFR